MAIQINGEMKRIGLALSGGGFRAAAFHHGVFRKLESIGLLWKIDLLSCVSGGSIAGGFLATNWGKPDTLDRLEQYLKTKSIAVSSVLGGILNPFTTRLDELAKSYDRDLFNGMTLSALKNGPRIYFNATNLSTGNAFFFHCGRKQEVRNG
jgi:NTE family protein